MNLFGLLFLLFSCRPSKLIFFPERSYNRCTRSALFCLLLTLSKGHLEISASASRHRHRHWHRHQHCKSFIFVFQIFWEKNNNKNNIYVQYTSTVFLLLSYHCLANQLFSRLEYSFLNCNMLRLNFKYR